MASEVRYPGQEPPWPTTDLPSRLRTEKPSPLDVRQSGSINCTRCISYRVEAFSNSCPPLYNNLNCQEAKRARSSTFEENPAAGVIPLAWKKGILSRCPSL